MTDGPGSRDLNRRSFLETSAVFGTALFAGKSLLAAEPKVAADRWQICVFVKFLQSLSFSDLASRLAELGVQGIEATVRPGGQILPEQVEEKLPQLVETLRRQKLDVTIMASGVNRVDSPHAEKVLRTAAALGIKQYRMDYYRYDLSKPVVKQIQELKPVVKDLAALNQELGLQAIYQNHAGATMLGASVWDLHLLLEDVAPEQIGIAYDTRHAAVEAGYAWPVSWNLVQPRLASVFVKNARWNGRSARDIPLGEAGVVDPAIFNLIKASKFNGSVSLHVEYLEKGTVDENLAAIQRDLSTLQNFLGIQRK